MAFGKWIGGWLGWINSQSILGALAGFALGSIFDIFTDSGSRPRQNINGQYDDGEAYGEAGKAAAGERNGQGKDGNPDNVGNRPENGRDDNLPRLRLRFVFVVFHAIPPQNGRSA